MGCRPAHCYRYCKNKLCPKREHRPNYPLHQMQRCACTCHSGSSPSRMLQNPQSFRRSSCQRSGDSPTSTRKTIIGQRRWCSKYNDDRDWGVSWPDRTSLNSPDLLPTCQFLPSPLPPLLLFERRRDPSPPATRSSFFGRIRRLSGEHHTPTSSPPLHRNTPASPLPTGAAPCPAIPALWIRTGHMRLVCIGACPSFRTTSLSLSSHLFRSSNSMQQMSSPVRSDTMPSMYSMLPSPSPRR